MLLIRSARQIDVKTANEIQAQIKNGFIGNANNEYIHRMATNSKRTTERIRKSKAHAELQTSVSYAQDQIEQEKSLRKVSLQRQKVLQAELGLQKGQKQKSKGVKVPNENYGSSSGRAIKGRVKARNIANPYPTREFLLPFHYIASNARLAR
jgi:hypothetical protein